MERKHVDRVTYSQVVHQRERDLLNLKSSEVGIGLRIPCAPEGVNSPTIRQDESTWTIHQTGRVVK